MFTWLLHKYMLRKERQARERWQASERRAKEELFRMLADIEEVSGISAVSRGISGVPWIADDDCDPRHIYFINSRHIDPSTDTTAKEA